MTDFVLVVLFAAISDGCMPWQLQQVTAGGS
jgi:hypothetical protein